MNNKLEQQIKQIATGRPMSDVLAFVRAAVMHDNDNSIHRAINPIADKFYTDNFEHKRTLQEFSIAIGRQLYLLKRMLDLLDEEKKPKTDRDKQIEAANNKPTGQIQ